MNKKYPTLRRAEFSLEGEECCTFEDAYAAMVPLQQRISELEAQIAQLTESLETASSAVIVLKQQQREGWAQLASGQEPVAWWNEDGVRLRYSDTVDVPRGTPLYLHPAPAQQPLSDAQINSACLSRDHSFGLMDANKRALMICSAREWERAFAKEKP